MRKNYNIGIIVISVFFGFLTCGSILGEGGLHLPHKDRVGRRIVFKDGKGYPWDIVSSTASVQHGLNNCYDGRNGGMRLSIYIDGVIIAGSSRMNHQNPAI